MFPAEIKRLGKLATGTWEISLTEPLADAAPPISDYFNRTSTGSSTVMTDPARPSIHAHASLGADNGAIALLRYRQPALSLHSNIHELGDGLANAFAREPSRGMWPESSIIMGHGSPGSIEVGDGQMGWSQLGTIELYNAAIWMPELERIVAPHVWIQASHAGPKQAFHRRIHLMSCSTAAGPEGRALLQAMANAANASVSAHTGLIHASRYGARYEKGVNIPWCVPEGSPAKQCPESYWRGPHDHMPSAKSLFFAKVQTGEKSSIGPVLAMKVIKTRGGKTWELPPEIAQKVADALLQNGPYNDDGGIAAGSTATIEIEFRDAPTMRGDLLADRLFVTADRRAYFSAPGCLDLIEELASG